MAKRGPKGPSKYTHEFIEKEAELLRNFARNHEAIPFLCGFAAKRGYSEQRLSEFAKKNEKFSEAVNELKAIQKEKILMLSLAGKINPYISSLILKSNHGMTDRTEVKHEGEIRGDGEKIIVIFGNERKNSEDSIQPSLGSREIPQG